MKEWIPQFTHHKQCTVRVFIKTVWPYFFFFTKNLQLLLFLYPIQDTPWLPVKADGDLIWDIRICGIQRVGWLFHSPTQVKTCNTKNIIEKKNKLKQIKVNTELTTKIQNSHISLVGTICNFLTPPPPPTMSLSYC